MLTDKTQLLNRLQNSNISSKTNSFGQTIKNPYMAQYKIFEQRLKNPKLKCRSLIMRKNRDQVNMKKDKIESQIKIFRQNQCLRQAKSIINNQNNYFSLFPHRTIDDDLQQSQKQAQILLKFKERIYDIKILKSDINIEERSQISFNLGTFSRYHLTQAPSTIGSQRKKFISIKPHTATNIYENKRRKLTDRKYQSYNPFQKSKISKPRGPINFIHYKRDKKFTQRFNKENS